MNQEQFEQKNRDTWLAFERLMDSLDKKANAESGEELDSFPQEYRRLCKHLALARDRQYSAHLVDELNTLVMRGHSRLYASQGSVGFTLSKLLIHDFPAAVRREAKLFWIASLLFYGPYIAIIITLQFKPGLIYSFIGPEQVSEYEQMYSDIDTVERGFRENFTMFGFYIYNNISIALRTFSSGILIGVGTIFILLMNGTVIGAVTGHLMVVDLSHNFFPFVCGHGPFELTAIVLAGVAGLRMGLAILIPGNRGRKLALIETGRAVLPIVFGMTGMLVIAAFVEAFWSPLQLPLVVKYSVSAAFTLFLILYFLISGRRYEH